MIRTREVERTEIVTEMVAIGCNRCGEEVEAPYPGHEDAQRFHEFVACGSYSSVFPFDMTTLRFHLCATCLRKLVEGFEVEPEIVGWGPHG